MKTKSKSFSKTGACMVAAVFCVLCLQSSALALKERGALADPNADRMMEDVTQGALRIQTDQGIVESPLKHTDVKVDISGFIARVTVTQTFVNPSDEKVEAVYVFPLPHTAAVDQMTMVMGDRRIVGVIERRDQARAIYERALRRGQTASLLEQERPNIFTQSVGNIAPHQEVLIEISYVDVLKYDMGIYEFHFPMVVGPRYIPGSPVSRKPQMSAELRGKIGEVAGPEFGPDPTGTGWAPDKDRVPDASRITPPVLKPGYRTGHDIGLSLRLDAGVPIRDIRVVNHEADLDRTGRSGAVVTLAPADSIPNKDFVVRYKVVGEKPEMALLAHSRGDDQGYFLLMIQPAVERELEAAPPREIVFLIDVSGSMSGRPTEKVKETMRQFFKLSKPDDTFQVITFAGQANKLFAAPVRATEANISRALNFTQEIRGGGGTEMLKGVKMVLNEPVDPERVRIAVMLTDGFIGNEAEIIQEVGRRAGDQVRFWTLGIGSSPNRFLLDGVAKQGGGMSAVIELGTDPAKLVAQIVERIHRAQLSKIEIDWSGLSVYETYPRKIPELWAGRPVILMGRYAEGGRAAVKISGVAEGRPLSFRLDVDFPDRELRHDVLSKVWARQKIEDLSAQMFYAAYPDVVEEVTQIALDYGLMSQYTSFVAVDQSEVSDPGGSERPPRRMVVPVPLPEGVSYEGVFGPSGEDKGWDDYRGAMGRPYPVPGKSEALIRERVSGSQFSDQAAPPQEQAARFPLKAKYNQAAGAYRPSLGDEAKLEYDRALAEREESTEDRSSGGHGEAGHAMDYFSWKLLAGAYGKEMDLDALTELEAVWKDPKAGDVLRDSTDWRALRSVWAISLAAKSMAGNRELKALAGTVIRKLENELPGLITDAGQRPHDPAAFYRLLYAVLALDNANALKIEIQGGTRSKAADAKKLLIEQGGGAVLDAQGVVASALLAPSPEADKAFMKAMIEQRVFGDDLVALAGFGASQRGGQVWRTFREELPQMAAGQMLNGPVIVMVNRLRGIQ